MSDEPRAATDRLLDATERLCHDVSTLLLSHHDLHRHDGPGGPVGESKPSTGSKVIAVATNTACRKSATGQAGHVVVGVPVPTSPVSLVPLKVSYIVPGSLPTATYEATTQPTVVAPPADRVEVSISPNLPVGTYIGCVKAQAEVLSRPIVIYLDGLP
jgi:hypothetical protein